MQAEATMSLEEVAAWVAMDVDQIQRWHRRGTNGFPQAVRRGKDTLQWRREDIQKWLETEQKNEATEFVQDPQTHESLHPSSHADELAGEPMAVEREEVGHRDGDRE